jgi:hypothetical protein
VAIGSIFLRKNPLSISMPAAGLDLSWVMVLNPAV